MFCFWNFDDINYAAIKCLKTALVVDPVMVSTSGHTLAGPSILDSFRYVTLRVIDSFHALRVNSCVLLTKHLFIANLLLPYSWNINQSLNFLDRHAIYGKLSHAWIVGLSMTIIMSLISTAFVINLEAQYMKFHWYL